MEGDVFGAQLLSYHIYVNDGEGSSVQHVSTISTPTVRSYTHTGVTANRPYKFKVSVVSDVFEGELSDELTVWSCAYADASSSAPSMRTGTYNSSDDTFTLTLQWAAPSTSGGCVIQGYRLYRDPDFVQANGELLTGKGPVLNESLGNWTELYPGPILNDTYIPAIQPPNTSNETVVYMQMSNLDATVTEFTGAIPGLVKGNFYKFRVGVITSKGEAYSPKARVQAVGRPSALTVAPT